MVRKRICVITAGQLSTSPRMLKAADALAAHGYSVTLLSTSGWAKWAMREDIAVADRRAHLWKWVVVEWSRKCAFFVWLVSGIRFRALRRFFSLTNARRAPLRVLAAAHLRMGPEIVRAAGRLRCDLIYGGGSSLAATALAARHLRVPYALDLEDFHTAELRKSATADVAHRIIEAIERETLPQAAFRTAASDAIREAYTCKYRIAVDTINNTFPLPTLAPSMKVDSSLDLRLYWFSQTIGPERGIEDVIAAIALGASPVELHLRGRPHEGYLETLKQLAATQAGDKLKLIFHPPANPDDMVRLAAEYDIGLAVEPGFSLNNSLALSNKAFTYMLAGLAVVLTNTVGQAQVAATLGSNAIVYDPGDVKKLAARLEHWANDREALLRAKRASWSAATSRWHWEHGDERGKLLYLVANSLR